MVNVRYSNGSLFVQFADGDFSLTTCNKEFAQQVVTLINEGASKEEILIVLNPEFEKLQKEVEQIKQENKKVEHIVQSILNDDRFYLENGRLYRQGIPVSIPLVLADKIRQTIDEGSVDELNKLDKFWGWTSLIRNADSRESFYSYVEVNNIPITKEGFIVAFRRAQFMGQNQNKELVDFVTQEFMRLRKNKKSTNVDVWYCEDEDENMFYSTKEQGERYVVGNLKELYTSFSEHEDVVFESVTPNNQGQRLKYYIGKETRLNEDEVDWSDQECSAGIHCSNGGYNFGGYGDTALAVAVNPIV